jgi:hypothetical protein
MWRASGNPAQALIHVLVVFNWPGEIVMNSNGSIVLPYADTIAGHKTKTATMVYLGM